MTGFDVGGFGGGPFRIRRVRTDRPPRKNPRIWFWRELFRHINAQWQRLTGENYPWTNADRKILANLSRKYGVPAVMAMWDLYSDDFHSASHIQSGGKVYGLALDSAELRGYPEFKKRAEDYQAKLNALYNQIPAAQILESLGL